MIHKELVAASSRQIHLCRFIEADSSGESRLMTTKRFTTARCDALSNWAHVALALLICQAAAPAWARIFSVTQELTTGGVQTEVDFNVWIPEGDEPVRGMAFMLPGICGNSLFNVNLPHWRQAAGSLGFGLIGSDDQDLGHAGNPNCQWGAANTQEAAQNLDDVLQRVAESSGRAEIANAPVLMSGTSSGAFNASLIGTHAADRVIAYVAVRGGGSFYNPVPESLGVPGILLPGAKDGTVPPQFSTYPGFRQNREHDALVAFAPEWGRDHASGQSAWELGWYWMSEVTQLRYPAEQQPSTTAGEQIELKSLESSSGWLGESASFLPPADGNPFVPDVSASPFPEISPAASYSGDPATASWLPNEAIALAYRATTLIDPNRPLVRPAGQFLGGPMEFVSPNSFLPVNLDFSVPQPELHVGDRIEVRIDPREFDDEAAIVSMQFFEGSQLIGEDHDGPEWSVPLQLESSGIRGLVVVAMNEAGEQTSSFRAILVQPSLVPEPSSLTLLVIASMGAPLSRRRQWPGNPRRKRGG